ncbi:MAG: septum formation initiator family protein [Acidobacteria bacterium]|nr:septum formation initiator family protein [Acidobacteriota bacterium]
MRKVSRNGTFRTLGLLAGLALLGVYTLVTLRGPHGVAALESKREEIRILQERNADLKLEIEERTDRNRRLRESPEEQELEIRERLNLLRKGEKYFVVPETPKPKP